jgi:hypothetical protein
LRRLSFVVLLKAANMSLSFEERPSDVPLVHTVWRTQSERAAAFTSVAVSRWEVVLTRYFDQPHLTRALRRFVGHTPAEIARMNGFADMSVSYKTSEFSHVMPGS